MKDPRACWNCSRNWWFGVSAELQKSPGRMGGTPKVLSKLEMESDSLGADRRPSRIKGSSLVQVEELFCEHSKEILRC